jgi:hypothetical protein
VAQQGLTLRVKGYREFMRATARADKESKAYPRKVLRDVGDTVRDDAVRRFSPVDSRSAAGYRTRVRITGVAVQQSLRKTTGARPRYGSLQMRRALLPALLSHRDDLERQMDIALGLIERHFERGL